MEQIVYGSKSKTALECHAMKPKFPLVRIGMLESMTELPQLVVLKIDGEMQVIDYDSRREKRKRIICKNGYGRWRLDFRAARQLARRLRRMGLKRAILMGELFATSPDGKIIPFNHAVSIVKGKKGSPVTSEKEKQIRLMIWGVVEIEWRDRRNLVPEFDEFSMQWAFIKKFPKFNTTSTINFCRPLYWKVKGPETIRHAFNWTMTHSSMMTEGKLEGIVGRIGAEAKIKEDNDIDAVVIARYLKGKERKHKTGPRRSFLVALMDRKGRFVEIGRVGGGFNDLTEAKINRELEPLKLYKDGPYIWYRPKVVVKLTYSAILPAREATNAIYKLKGGRYRAVGYLKCGHLRYPRFQNFRKDKEVNSQDLRLNQLGVSLKTEIPSEEELAKAAKSVLI